MIRTEMRNPRTTHIDRMTTEEMVSLIAKENYAVVKAVEEQTTAMREPRAGSAFWMLRNVPLPSALSVIW